MLLAVALAASSAALACLPVPGDPIQRETRACRDADVVFVATLGETASVAPDADFPWTMSTSSFEVVEVLRGSPDADARIATEDPAEPGLRRLPPHSCLGSGLRLAGSEGRRLLVFATAATRDGRTLYRLARGSRFLDNCSGCDDALARLRRHAQTEPADLPGAGADIAPALR
ncbi:hypothetical protein [Luteimonas sp. FCS-9]|uniref:hypothetical protein n=1 Tax=Luteimonas sp. FCS-9 TaxID=1547516 RepID=UPI0012E001B6|nr:hypothetical protein [Luteimonas sp. FCS-9]